MANYYNPKNFKYKVYEWTFSKLKLPVNEALVFSVIYEVSSKGELFRGNADFIAKCINCSTSQVVSILKKLTGKGLLKKIIEGDAEKSYICYRHSEKFLKAKGIV